MNNPYIKVEWEDTSENLTQERIKRVKSYFERKYNSTNVKVVTKIATNDSTTKLKSLEVSDNILDHQYQKKLVKDFIEDNKISIEWDKINRLDDKVNGEIDKINQNRVRYNKWNLKKVEFSNFLSFGDDNSIDFTVLDGVTVVESTPRNFGGKSTATVDLLLFLFFNSTTKTKTNIEVFNKFTDKDEVKVKGYVTIDGDNYIISRIVSRKKSKSGEYTVKNDLEFFKESEDGSIMNLSGEQRAQTEKIISSAIGSEDDFLSTILTTSNNLEELIESKPTARGQILTKFLGLENIKQKEEIAKGIYTEWSKKLISNNNNISDLTEKNNNHTDAINNSETLIEELTNKLQTVNEKLKDLETKREDALRNRNNDIDQELINVNPTNLQKEIDVLIQQKSDILKNVESILVIEPKEYYSEEDHEHAKTEINKILVINMSLADQIGKNNNLIKQFEDGSICPTCNRPLDDVDHTDEIEKIKNTISEDEKTLKNNEENILVDLSTTEKKFSELKKQLDEYEKNKLRKARYELDGDQKQLEIDNKKTKLNNYNKNKQKLEENAKIDTDIVFYKTQIETCHADIRQISTSIEKEKNNIVNLKEKIQTNLDLIKKIKSEEELISVFKTYFTIYGKNGITKVIIKNMIPLLNQELHRLLNDSCYFTLELSINDKNELEFLMIDNETRVIKPLSSGSGYEKSISSLAIRSVLTKVSSLPKPNVVVMDEVFGKIADDNLEMVGEFFKKIKNYFEHILVISHNPLIRNWSDNIIMIKKTENVSEIEYTTTKIS
jgi:DNA repair exonuclease SbcCD ATPase subunit